MLRNVTLLGGLSRVLEVLRPCFTAPTFETFSVLVTGLFAAPVGRTVCGMLTGAGLAQVWHHARAHRFFSAARWCPHQLGLAVAQVVVSSLLAPGAPIPLAVDDTLLRRRGKKVHGVGWFHDGSAAGQVKLGFAEQLGGGGDHRDAAVPVPAASATGARRVSGERRCHEAGPGP
jgi:hypothetical protein